MGSSGNSAIGLSLGWAPLCGILGMPRCCGDGCLPGLGLLSVGLGLSILPTIAGLS